MTAHDETSPAAGLAATRPPVALVAGAARVAFVWRGDRWSHGLTLPGTGAAAAGDAAARDWQSVDGVWPADGDPRWPASPAVVELSRVGGSRAAPDRDAAAILGVGMAGRSHYSASVIRDPLVADAVRFEIACRLHDGPGWLGSTYRCGPLLVRIEAWPGAGSLPRTVVWSYSIGPGGVFGVHGATVSTSHA